MQTADRTVSVSKVSKSCSFFLGCSFFTLAASLSSGRCPHLCDSVNEEGLALPIHGAGLRGCNGDINL